MSRADVERAVSAYVPCCHMEWPGDSRPPIPFACYLLDRDTPIAAGDVQVAVKRKWIVELYEVRRDKELEAALADGLREAFGPVRRDESWVEDDGLLMVTYTFYEIEGEFDG